MRPTDPPVLPTAIALTQIDVTAVAFTAYDDVDAIPVVAPVIDASADGQPPDIYTCLAHRAAVLEALERGDHTIVVHITTVDAFVLAMLGQAQRDTPLRAELRLAELIGLALAARATARGSSSVHSWINGTLMGARRARARHAAHVPARANDARYLEDAAYLRALCRALPTPRSGTRRSATPAPDDPDAYPGLPRLRALADLYVRLDPDARASLIAAVCCYCNDNTAVGDLATLAPTLVRYVATHGPPSRHLSLLHRAAAAGYQAADLRRWDAAQWTGHTAPARPAASPSSLDAIAGTSKRFRAALTRALSDPSRSAQETQALRTAVQALSTLERHLSGHTVGVATAGSPSRADAAPAGMLQTPLFGRVG